MKRSHLVGIGGTGMSALAEALADAGGVVTGSDRFFDQATAVPALEALARRGIALFPQDGSGVAGADRVVASTAIEADNPDLLAARARDIPVVHRAAALSELLAAQGSLVAVAGTCGKSTTTALLGHLLACAGMDPVVVNGAAVLDWRAADRTGAVRRGRGRFCVAEVDESDRSLLAFHPHASLVLNASEDHFSLEETNKLFDAFLAQTTDVRVDARGRAMTPCEEGDWSVSFDFSGRRLTLPLPGAHHATDAALACEVAAALGADVNTFAPALASFHGLARRLERVGRRADGLVAVDDYAHNTEKIRATLHALQARTPQLIAVWRPHGYAPLRKMWDALTTMFAETLRPQDTLLVLPVFDVGGTATRDVNAADFAAQLAARGVCARAIASHAEATAFVRDLRPAAAPAAYAPAIAVTLGARDPALPALARSFL